MLDSFAKDHRLLIMQKVYKFLTQRSMCDLSIYVEDSCFHLHKCILAASCPLLHYLVLQSMEISKQGPLSLVLNGIKTDGFKAVVNYIYSGKIPNDVSSKIWSDFVHACEYLSIPYPVYKQEKISLYQPKEEVYVTLSPNADGKIGVSLRKESELPVTENEMDIPIETTEEKKISDCENETKLDELSGEWQGSPPRDSVVGGHFLFEMESQAQNGHNESVFDLNEGVTVKVQKTAKCNYGLKSDSTVNCCGRFLIEIGREKVATCEKISYTCSLCKRIYVAVGGENSRKASKSTQTLRTKDLPVRIEPEVDTAIKPMDEHNYGAQVEIGDVTYLTPVEENADVEFQVSTPSQSGFLETGESPDTEESHPAEESDDSVGTTLVRKTFYSPDGVYRPYCCDRCGGRYERKSTLTKHQELHCGDTRHGVRCLSCNKVYACRSSFRNHVKNLHPGENVRAADLQQKFEKKVNVRKIVAARKAKFLCEICDTGYEIERHFVVHREKCEKLRKFKCNHCPMGFRRRIGWEKHLWQRHNVRK